jgi:DNA-binding response OmpR family regulator
VTARILIVDDEPGMRRSLAIMLRREGFDVTEAASVADAVGRLKGEAYNLVIADLRMDPLNGLDLLMLARRHRPQCPVIIVTAYGSAEARTEALDSGAVDFLEKPLQAGVLQARIHQLLDTHGR